MAWAEQLANGMWRGIYTIYIGGKRQRRTVPDGPFPTKTEAKRKAIILEDQQRKPGSVDKKAGQILWRDWWAEWMESHVIRPKTERNYTTTTRLHVMPYWGDVPLKDIDMTSAKRWVKRLAIDPVPVPDGVPPRRGRGQPRSPHTIRNAVGVFKTSLSAAVEAGRLVTNPVAGLEGPPQPTSVQRFLDYDEVESIAHHMVIPFNRLILWTLATTGLRAGELGGLHLSRLDLDRSLIRVAETLDQEALLLNPVPKDLQARWVPLPHELVELLRDHVLTLPKQATCGLKHYAGRCPGGPLVFRGVNGGPFRSDPWGRGPFRKAQSLAEITGRARVHDLRHTCASWLIQSGATLAEVGEVLGHSDTEVTKLYAHLKDDNYSAVRSAMSRALGRGAADGATGDSQPLTVDVAHLRLNVS